MKHVLIVTYHWPPSGGITVLRCLKIVKYLREFGWEPIVFTAENPSYQFFDESNLKDIPPNIEIHKVPIFEPVNVFKRISGRDKNSSLQNITSNSEKKKTFVDKFGMWVRGNFFIPDARCMWIKPSMKYLNEYLMNNKVDAIFTDGPPHTNTVIGMRLSEKFNIPWLADFQDPWTQVDYYDKLFIGKRADKKHRDLEQQVFRSANKITIASPTWKTDLERIGAQNVEVLYYGFDESDFQNYENKKVDDFVFFHGGLLGEDRNPVIFLKALSLLLEEHPSLKVKIKIRLAGEVDYSVKKTIAKFGLDDVTEYLGMISREQIFKEYASAFMLLLPINKSQNAKGRIPGKLFEMLRAQKPILVIGPKDGDVKLIVESKSRGKSFDDSEFQQMYLFIKESIQNQNIDNFDLNQTVQEFSNYELTRKVAGLLDKIIV